MSCSCFPSLMHFCCCCMSPNATNVCQIAWVSPGLCSLLFSLLMHSDILVFTPQQHTIHVVVSCIFHNLGSLIVTVVLSRLYPCSCLICDLTDHMNVSLGKWDGDPHNGSLYVDGRERWNGRLCRSLGDQIKIFFLLISPEPSADSLPPSWAERLLFVFLIRRPMKLFLAYLLFI